MNKHPYNLHIAITAIAFVMIVMTGCASYYTKNEKFNRAVETGQFETADKILEKDTKSAKNRNQLLYFLNRGYVAWMLNDFPRSVNYFNTSENLIDDYSRNIGTEALALVSNPMVKPYKAEDFEVVMVNCFKAINYMQMQNFEDAMVECRRINIKLNALNDKYPSHKNRYSRDAFALTMMGLLYDANRDYNNAFIAYRNALDVYETDYTTNFAVQAPEQLKRDLLRTAHLNGFGEELAFFEQKFGVKYKPEQAPQSEMVFFWMNGFGPFKEEWSFNLTLVKGAGVVTFVDEQNGISIPIVVGPPEMSELTDLNFIRVAFPKYVARIPYSKSASISLDNKQYPLELAENINEIAFKTLNDRMLREMATSLLRLAAKKALEAAAKSKDETAGFLVNILNAVTEKADTRNWQSLPYAISYTRIPLQEGVNVLRLNTTMTDGKVSTQEIPVQAQKGKVYFHAFHHLN